MTKKQRRRRRRLIRRIILSAAIIAAGIIAIVLVINFTPQTGWNQEEEKVALLPEDAVSKEGDEAEAAEQEESEEPEEVEEEPEPELPPPDPVSITLSFAGDCTLGTDVDFNQATSLPAYAKKYGDYSKFLSGVQSAFANDDYTVVNLEGPLTTSNDIREKAFNFKGDPELVQILTKGSVECVNVANNHSFDYGESGFAETKSVLENAGVEYFGYDRIAYKDLKGIVVAFVGMYELAQGIGIEGDMVARIDAAKANGADLVVVSYHWGTERQYYPEYNQTYLAKSAIDHGADLVVGHHPHVLQGVGTYNGKKICYSLGNFCFGGNSNPSDKDTMIFRQTFTFNPVKNENPASGQPAYDFVNSGDYENIEIVPCRLSSVTSTNDYCPTVLTGDDAARLMGKIEEYSAGL